jgi:hypothetical protein
MKILQKNTTFETNTIILLNDIKYLITTRGELFPDNKKSRAITFNFKRLDGAKLTNKEEKISDKLFDEIIKDNKEL